MRGAGSEHWAGDIADPRHREAGGRASCARTARLDVLVNNAGGL